MLLRHHQIWLPRFPDTGTTADNNSTDSSWVVELKELNPGRATDKPVSADRFGTFSKSLAYEGWRRSQYPLEWFDSRPERTVANIVDDDDDVVCWVRLHTGELPILWNSAGQQYNPDLVVVETDETHWVVEVKMDKEMTSADVQGKRDAAQRWANYVTVDDSAGTTWRYLLVSESDVDTARGPWPALKKARRIARNGGLPEASGFTGRSGGSPRLPPIPARPRSSPVTCINRPHYGFGRHAASPPVPARPAPQSVGRSEGGAKSLGLGARAGPAPGAGTDQEWIGSGDSLARGLLSCSSRVLPRS